MFDVSSGMHATPHCPINISGGDYMRLLGVLVQNFCISLGVITGGAMIGAMSAIFTGQPPQRTILELAERLKIWAMVTALGGTFESIRMLEMGLFGGEFQTLIKQILLIVSAFGGAQLGYYILESLVTRGRP